MINRKISNVSSEFATTNGFNITPTGEVLPMSAHVSTCFTGLRAIAFIFDSTDLSREFETHVRVSNSFN